MGWLTGLEPATSGATIRYRTANSLNSGASAPAFRLPNQAIYTDYLHRLLSHNQHLCMPLAVHPYPACVPPGVRKRLSFIQMILLTHLKAGFEKRVNRRLRMGLLPHMRIRGCKLLLSSRGKMSNNAGEVVVAG